MIANFQMKDVQLAKVQGNPKTHKQGNEMRLIVNSRQLPTVKIAQYVEEQLEPHVTNQNSFIKDTNDLLVKLQNIKLDPHKKYYLFCMDVKALYPSVPRIETREAVRNALETRIDQETAVDTIL